MATGWVRFQADMTADSNFYPCHGNKRSSCISLFSKNERWWTLHFFKKFSLPVASFERYYIHVNDVCKQMQKQSTKGRTYSKEILRTTFFLIKDRLICFLFKYSLLGHQVWILFLFYFSKTLGRSGDGKRNILFGWPY